MPTTLKRKSSSPAFDNDTVTPEGSPAKKMRLTQSQKQALMANLQLEITERARKLRAQYALQANDLRARIERRVNRIPVSLRKANMGELLEKHSVSASQPQTTSPSRKQAPSKATRNAANISVDQETSTGTGRGRRTSRDGHFSDKENAPATSENEGLKNPKRRGKGAAAGGAPRVVSQEVRGDDYRILSPKSLNSRTYPQSPFRASPDKGQQSYLSRPTSPLKASSPLRSSGWDSARSRPRGATTSTVKDNTRPPSQAKKVASRAVTGPKPVRSPLPRPATRQHERKNSTGTVSSTTSSGTTVMKPTRTGAAARKAPPASTAAAATKRPTIPKTQTPSLAVKKAAATARKTTAPAATTEGSAAGSTAGRRALRRRV